MLYHNSHSEGSRMPVGAIPCGKLVRIRFWCDESDTVLLHTFDGQDHEQPMLHLEGDLFEAILPVPEKPMLFWYDFLILKDGTRLRYGNSEDQSGGEGRCYEGFAPSYQITVYDPAYTTPEFLRKGIIYQIFPDRFHRGEAPVMTEAIQRAHPEASFHQDWNEKPLLDLSPEDGDNRALDFFGGNLRGITEKLDELRELGITVLYLNPIFLSRSNHRYDTGSYEQIDPILGNEEDFRRLCGEAEKRGMRVLLDGVFSHTGSDSQYFNRFGRYDSVGAWQSPKSEYFSWYCFEEYPYRYKSWWGFQTLPNLNKNSVNYRHYLLNTEDGILPRWLREGASGWRLDVADELPMDLIAQMRQSVKRCKPEACLLGEVWEDASNKVSYGQARSYCLGDTLDSVMNYPLRTAIIDFLTGRIGAGTLCRLILHQREVYPAPFHYSLMNLLGSHDRARIANVLAGYDPAHMPSLTREEAGAVTLTAEEKALARKRYLLALRLLCALPGSPTLYYGDELGMTGMADPWNRAPMDWVNGDLSLREEVRKLLTKRAGDPVLQTGYLDARAEGEDEIVIRRFLRDGRDIFGQALSGQDQEIKICRL